MFGNFATSHNGIVNNNLYQMADNFTHELDLMLDNGYNILLSSTL